MRRKDIFWIDDYDLFYVLFICDLIIKISKYVISIKTASLSSSELLVIYDFFLGQRCIYL